MRYIRLCNQLPLFADIYANTLYLFIAVRDLSHLTKNEIKRADFTFGRQNSYERRLECFTVGRKGCSFDMVILKGSFITPITFAASTHPSVNCTHIELIDREEVLKLINIIKLATTVEQSLCPIERD